MITIPLILTNQRAKEYYEGFKDQILKNQENKKELRDYNFTSPSMIHLTLLQMDLSTDEKLNKAKTMMKELETVI